MQRAWWVMAAAVGLVGCFPDYELEPDAQPYMSRMRTAGRTVEFDLLTDAGNRRSSVSFSYDFDIDQYEVTVARFNAWWHDGSPELPADLASLDEGGVYEQQMRWRAGWNTVATSGAFVWANPDVDTEQTCTGPSNTPLGVAPWTTWKMEEAGVTDAGDFPMTCVTWMQAAAFCAAEGKRLPTAAEWTFARTEGGDAPAFPWGNQPPNCDDAIVNADGDGCGFPTAVSTTDRDRTKAGVDDLVGSVFEWLWEASWPDAITEEDWTGSSTDVDSPDREHLRAGGAFISDPTEARVGGVVEKYGANQQYYDAGFRCARSVK